MAGEALIAFLLAALPGDVTATVDPVACVDALDQPDVAARMAQMLNAQGIQLRQQKDLPGALAAFRLAAAMQPQEAEYTNNLGFLYELNAQPELAEHHYRAAIQLDGRRAVAHLNLGELLLARVLAGAQGRDRTRDLEEAAEHLQRVADVPGHDPWVACPQVRVAALRGQCAAALGGLESCKKAAPAKQRKKIVAESQAALGQCFLQAGDLAAAETALQQAAAGGFDVTVLQSEVQAVRERTQVPPPVERARAARTATQVARQVLERLEKDQELGPLEDQLREAVRSAPDTAIVHAAWGEVQATRRPDEAELAWLRALRMDLPDEGLQARALAGLGRLYLRWRQAPRAAEAAEVLADAVRLRPTDQGLRWDLVQALRAAGQLRKALTELDKWLVQAEVGPDGQRRDALALRRSLEATVGPVGAAPEPLVREGDGSEEVPDVVSQAGEAVLLEARRLAGQDRFRAAAAVLQRYLGKGRPTPEIYNDLARYQVGVGDLDAAVEALRGSLKTAEAQPAVHHELARWLLRLGRQAQARPHLERAVALGVEDAAVALAALDVARPDDGIEGLSWDLRHRTTLAAARSRLERYLAVAPTRKDTDPQEIAAARLLHGEVDDRLVTLNAVLALGLALALGLLGLLAWIRWGGHDLRTLIEQHPDTGPEVQRVLAAIRHEVLKHNTTVLTGLVEAVAAGQPAGELADHVRRSLLGSGGVGGALDRLDAYAHELKRVGRARGVRLNLRRRDPALQALLHGAQILQRASGRLARIDRLAAWRRRQLLRELREATRLLHSDGYDAVRNLLDSLRMLRIDRALLQAVFDRTRAEPGLVQAPVAPLVLETAVELPVHALLPRRAFEDILANLLRNALQASLDHGGVPAQVGLSIEAEVSPVTGIERLVFAVRDASPAPLEVEQLRGGPIERGTGLVTDLVSRYDGSVDVRPEAPPWRKAVVVKLPRAQPGETSVEAGLAA